MPRAGWIGQPTRFGGLCALTSRVGWHYQCVTEQLRTLKEGRVGHRNEAVLLCLGFFPPQYPELVHLPLQLTGLTSSISDMILGHLFSQVSGCGRRRSGDDHRGLERFGVTSLGRVGSGV